MRIIVSLLALCALAAAATASARPQSTRTLAFVAKPSGTTNMIRGKKAPQPGSSFLEYGTLVGAQRGTSALQGVLAAPLSVGVEISTDAFVLPGGTLVAVGSHRTVDRFALPVVGGTGAYAGAHGTLAIAPGAKGTERLTLTLD